MSAAGWIGVSAPSLARGLKVGDASPRLDVATVDGAMLHIGAPSPHGMDTLLLFVSPGGPVCKSLLPALRSIRRGEEPRAEVILAGDGPEAEHGAFVAAESLQEFPRMLSERLGLAFGAGRLPHAASFRC